MSRRLPLLGDTGTARGRVSTEAEGGEQDRLEVPTPTVVVFAAGPTVGGTGELARALVAAFSARGRSVSVLSTFAGEEGAPVRRAGDPGAPPLLDTLRAAGAREALGVAGSGGEAQERLRLAYAQLGDVDVVVGRGALLARVLRPTVTVMLTGAISPVGWSPEARALRAEVEVVLADPREGFARALAEAWPQT